MQFPLYQKEDFSLPPSQPCDTVGPLYNGFVIWSFNHGTQLLPDVRTMSYSLITVSVVVIKHYDKKVRSQSIMEEVKAGTQSAA